MKNLAGYEAVHHDAGWRSLSRGVLTVEGTDQVTFLHAMLSNDVSSLEDFQGVYSTLLTATGKILADFHVYRFSESSLIVLDRSLCDSLKARLEGFIVMDDVSLTDLSEEFGHISIHGPKASSVVSLLPFPELPAGSLDVVEASFEGGVFRCICKPEVSAYGYELIYPRENWSIIQDGFREAGSRFGLVPISDEAWEVLRLEAGVPVFGVDFSDQNNPIEAGLVDAYSVTKGCYPGQEVIAKATNIGGVARLLRRLAIQGASVPEAGSSLFLDDEKKIGWITSSVWSPRLGCPIALGYIRRMFAVSGQTLRVGSADGHSMAAEVVTSFLDA